MVRDTLKLFEWMAEHLQEAKIYNDKFISNNDVLDFHSWYIYETNLKKLCKEIDPKISILIGNFTNQIIYEDSSNLILGKLIRILLKHEFLFSITNDDVPNTIRIDVEYDIVRKDIL